MNHPQKGKLALPAQVMAMSGALFLAGGLGAQGRSDIDQNPLKAFEQEQAQIQKRIEQEMRDLERRIHSLKKRLEKERLGAGKVPGKQGRVIERSSESEIQMRMGKDGVRVEIKEKGSDGKVKKRVYEDKDLKSLLRAHPELKKKIAVGGGVGFSGFSMPDLKFGFKLGPNGKFFGLPQLGGELEMLREFMKEMQQMGGGGFGWSPFGPQGFPGGSSWQKPQNWAPPAPVPPAPGQKGNGVRVFKINQGKHGKARVRIEVRTPNGRRAYEGKNLKEILRKHPELRGKIQQKKSKGLQPEFRFRKGKVDSRPPSPIQDGPKLGIFLKENALNSAIREYLDIPEGAGLWVQKIVPGSLAERMGMREKDILLRLNGRLIKGPRDVAKVLGELEDDAPVKAEVLRRGREVVLKSRR